IICHSELDSGSVPAKGVLGKRDPEINSG
ncbi:MAG: hypothetical protein ACD_48C00212G0002, partial [uncultured bacterium]